MKKIYEKPEIVVSSLESKDSVTALGVSDITAVTSVVKTTSNVISF